MLFTLADTMHAPPGSQTQGEVHLTDNPGDWDVITTGWEHTAPSVRKKTTTCSCGMQRKIWWAKRGESDTALPFASFLWHQMLHSFRAQTWGGESQADRKRQTYTEEIWVDVCRAVIEMLPALFCFFHWRFTLLRSGTIVLHFLWDKVGVSHVLMALRVTVSSKQTCLKETYRFLKSHRD